MSIVNDKMSDTPETDDQPVINAINENGYQVPCVDIEYARKLERERDDLQKAVNGLCEHIGVNPANTTLLAVEVLRIQREREEAITRRMETIMQCELYEQERDEAWESLREAWLAMDEMDGTDRMNDWQNKHANILKKK
jgi:hypothetical protein